MSSVVICNLKLQIPFLNGYGVINASVTSRPAPFFGVTGNGNTVRDFHLQETEDVPSTYVCSCLHEAKVGIVEQYVTGLAALSDEEDTDHNIFEHVRDYMYKSLQLKMQGHITEQNNLNLWKSHSECIKDHRTTLLQLYQRPFRYQCNCLAGIRMTVGRNLNYM
jgi:hypothetical protein